MPRVAVARAGLDSATQSPGNSRISAPGAIHCRAEASSPENCSPCCRGRIGRSSRVTQVPATWRHSTNSVANTPFLSCLYPRTCVISCKWDMACAVRSRTRAQNNPLNIPCPPCLPREPTWTHWSAIPRALVQVTRWHSDLPRALAFALKKWNLVCLSLNFVFSSSKILSNFLCWWSSTRWFCSPTGTLGNV